MTVNLTLQALLVLATAMAAGALMRRSSASARHAIYVSALAAVLLLPALGFLARVAPPQMAAIELPVITVSSADTAARSVNWMLWLERLWLAGVALLALRFLVGTARATWLRSMSREVDPGIREHDSIRVPMLFGWLRPVILLPSAARNWPEERRNAAIAHELAHARRGDCWWSLIIEAACAVYWFLPLVWLAAAAARREAERAADDSVLRAGTDPAAYASHLLDVAREASGHWELAAGVAMAEASQLERRIVSVLDDNARRDPLSRRMLAAIAGGAVLTLLLVSGAVTSRAQSVPAGTLEVIVLDPSGARVPHYKASIEDGYRRIQQTQAADSAGEARFVSLPPGDYLVEVQAPGFAALHKGVKLDAISGAKLELNIQPGRIFETVKVAGGLSSPPPAAPQRLRIGGNIQAGKLRNQPKPPYPQIAKERGIQGTVFLQAVILMDGTMGALEVLSAPDPSLADAALEAVRQWTYESTLLNGNPIEVVTKIAVNFTLAE